MSQLSRRPLHRRAFAEAVVGVSVGGTGIAGDVFECEAVPIHGLGLGDEIGDVVACVYIGGDDEAKTPSRVHPRLVIRTMCVVIWVAENRIYDRERCEGDE